MTSTSPFGATPPIGSESRFGASPAFGSEPTFGSGASLPQICVGAECVEVASGLYSFLDNELPAPQYRAIQAHLSSCPPCLAAFGFERQLHTTVQMRMRSSIECPTSLADRIRLAIGNETFETVFETNLETPFDSPNDLSEFDPLPDL